MPSFDLTARPWVPVRPLDAREPAEAGLAELLVRAHEFADITLPVPPAASALMRVLYLIAARVTGLADLDDAPDLKTWKRRRRKVLASGRFEANAVERYFSAYAGRFDLFGPDRPWLQDPRLAAECPVSSGVNKLVMDRASGNNLVWLSHDTDLVPRPVPAAEAAWWLLAWLYYGPSGMITGRTAGELSARNTRSGPLRSRVSFHPLGRNLFETLVAGIPYPDPFSGRPDRDLAPWEDEALPDPLGRPPTREGLAGLLAAQFEHALLLTPSPDGAHVTDARITWAWRMPTAEIPDPYLIYDTPRNGGAPYARYARSDRAVWRELDALLLQDTGSGQTRRPGVFSRLPDQSLTGKLRIRAFGFDQAGQAVNRAWFTASTPPVLAAHDTGDGDQVVDDAALIGAAREAAERVGDDLRRALRQAWNALSGPEGAKADAPEGPWTGPALSRYWSGAEAAFWHMTAHPAEFAFPANRFIRIAVAVFAEATDRYAERGPRAARAIETARRTIFSAWSRDEPSPTEDPDA